MINVQYEQDASHGWLIVSAADVAQAGLTAKDFSAFSYATEIDGRMMFALEEDCDASRFHSASVKRGIEWNVHETHSSYSDVRSWPSIERITPNVLDQIIAEVMA